MKGSEPSKDRIVPKKNLEIRNETSSIIRRGLDEIAVETPRKKIRILHVNQSAISRDAIRKRIRFEDDVEIVGDSASSLDAIDLYKELKPDILLSYTHFEEISGFQLAKEIRKIDPQAKVLLFTVHDSLYYIRWSIRLGVKGYILMPASGDTLSTAFREIYTSSDPDYFYFDVITQIYSLLGDFLQNVQLKRMQGMNSLSEGALIQIYHQCKNAQNPSSTSTLELDDIKYLDLNDYRIKEIDFSMITRMKNLQKLVLPPGVLSEAEISRLRSEFRILVSPDYAKGPW
jgi:DNA-binding NarL/FixJ family response regulator